MNEDELQNGIQNAGYRDDQHRPCSHIGRRLVETPAPHFRLHVHDEPQTVDFINVSVQGAVYFIVVGVTGIEAATNGVDVPVDMFEVIGWPAVPMGMERTVPIYFDLHKSSLEFIETL